MVKLVRVIKNRLKFILVQKMASYQNVPSTNGTPGSGLAFSQNLTSGVVPPQAPARGINQ